MPETPDRREHRGPRDGAARAEPAEVLERRPRRRDQEREQTRGRHDDGGRTEAQPGAGPGRDGEGGEHEQEGELFGEDGQAEERAGQDPAPTQRLCRGGQGQAQAHDVLRMVELHDGAAGGGEEGEEGEECGDAAGRVRVGCPQE